MARIIQAVSRKRRGPLGEHFDQLSPVIAAMPPDANWFGSNGETLPLLHTLPGRDAQQVQLVV
jgi:hypothetical protein